MNNNLGFEIVPNIVEANGKTIRENNMAMSHNIPFGTLVEVNCDYCDEHGVRAFVVSHDRDCDGTPLYGLGFDPDPEAYTCSGTDPFSQAVHNMLQDKINRNWSEESLIIIKTPA